MLIFFKSNLEKIPKNKLTLFIFLCIIFHASRLKIIDMENRKIFSQREPPYQCNCFFLHIEREKVHKGQGTYREKLHDKDFATLQTELFWNFLK